VHNATVPGNPDSPRYELVDITPALAKEWLDRNSHNRNIRERVVNGYAADMLAGNWVEDGQSIKFSADGVLLDGQHRLSAIVQSGMTVHMLVVTNLAASTQDTMDTGAKRSLADVLKLHGEEHYVTLAAALLRVHVWKQGARKNIKQSGNARPTHRQLLSVLDGHPELRRSVQIGSRVRDSVRISGGTVALCHWLFNRIDQGDCAFFFARIADGAGLVPGDPVYALRRAIDNLAKASGRPDEAFVTALVIKAWNFYRAGQDIQLLAYRPGGAHPEPYPEPK
jgi:hypothetical protein